jgi:hypothetical protein
MWFEPVMDWMETVEIRCDWRSGQLEEKVNSDYGNGWSMASARDKGRLEIQMLWRCGADLWRCVHFDAPDIEGLKHKIHDIHDSIYGHTCVGSPSAR